MPLSLQNHLVSYPDEITVEHIMIEPTLLNLIPKLKHEERSLCLYNLFQTNPVKSFSEEEMFRILKNGFLYDGYEFQHVKFQKNDIFHCRWFLPKYEKRINEMENDLFYKILTE